jgi:hypothetical protein
MTDSTYSHQSIRPCVAMEDFHQRIALPLDLPTPSRADVCRPHRDDVLDHPHRGTGSIPPSVSRGVFPESSVQRGTGSATPKSRRPPPPSDLARRRGSWSQRRAHHLPRPPTTSRAEQSKGRGMDGRAAARKPVGAARSRERSSRSSSSSRSCLRCSSSSRAARRPSEQAGSSMAMARRRVDW